MTQNVEPLLDSPEEMRVGLQFESEQHYLVFRLNARLHGRDPGVPEYVKVRNGQMVWVDFAVM